MKGINLMKRINEIEILKTGVQISDIKEDDYYIACCDDDSCASFGPRVLNFAEF